MGTPLNETKFKKRVKKDLEKLGRCAWYVKVQQQSIHGTPDILMCLLGKFIAIELKKNSAEVATPLQRYNLEQICVSGGEGYVVHPGNWECLFKELCKRAESTEEVPH